MPFSPPVPARKVEYDAVKRELSELLAQEETLQKKKLILRKKLEIIADLCELEGIQIDPSPEAAYLLEQSLADEVRAVLAAQSDWIRPSEIRTEFQRVGRDLSKYGNVQSAIQMVLKRMVDAKEIETKLDENNKSVYRRKKRFLDGTPPRTRK
jgi:hypothetical protein